MFLHRVGEAFDDRIRSVMLRRRHDPQAPLVKGEVGHPGERAQHGRRAVAGDSLRHGAAVALAGDLVQHDAGRGKLRIEGFAPAHKGRYRAARLGAVDHEQKRNVEKLHQLRKARRAFCVKPVEQAAVSLDHGPVGAGIRVAIRTEVLLVFKKVEVEVVAGDPRRGGEP